MPKVSVGLTSQAGYGVAVTAFALALAQYLAGDHNVEDTQGLVLAGAGLVVFLVTTIGRYWQALVIAKHQPVPVVVADHGLDEPYVEAAEIPMFPTPGDADSPWTVGNPWPAAADSARAASTSVIPAQTEGEADDDEDPDYVADVTDVHGANDRPGA